MSLDLACRSGWPSMVTTSDRLDRLAGCRHVDAIPGMHGRDRDLAGSPVGDGLVGRRIVTEVSESAPGCTGAPERTWAQPPPAMRSLVASGCDTQFISLEQGRRHLGRAHDQLQDVSERHDALGKQADLGCRPGSACPGRPRPRTRSGLWARAIRHRLSRGRPSSRAKVSVRSSRAQ